ncbi:hypothetical protein HPB51_001408 [Rhipicephalus microplus]|uniref:THAP-type domain-containing protein n=1 Tax=Rhipicephalus microplus TaxID=6941 RepID=A0A9J6EEC9_RHIMP|nr:hypothetical protein HPB51_001408 [Rhipicephalus microplus]
MEVSKNTTRRHFHDQDSHPLRKGPSRSRNVGLYLNCGWSNFNFLKEKYSLFTPPNEPSRLEAWRRAIPRKDRVLLRTDRVCEKHFALHFIMKTWSAEIDGHVLMSGKRRTGLAKDAVPSIFEGAPRYLSKKIKSPRKQVKRQAHRVAPSTSTSHSGSCTEPMPTSPGEISSASGVSAEMPCDSSTVTAAREPYANALRDLSFEELFNSTPGISIPQSSWAVHRTDAEGVRNIVFIDAAVTHRTSDGSSLVFNRKALHVKSDMTVQAYVFGKQVGTAALGFNPSVSTVSELDTMLSVMNSTSVCCGGPNLKDFPGVAPECAFVDCQGN